MECNVNRSGRTCNISLREGQQVCVYVEARTLSTGVQLVLLEYCCFRAQHDSCRRDGGSPKVRRQCRDWTVHAVALTIHYHPHQSVVARPTDKMFHTAVAGDVPNELGRCSHTQL